MYVSRGYGVSSYVCQSGNSGNDKQFTIADTWFLLEIKFLKG